MKALTWHGKRDVRVDDVPDPKIEEPTDAIVRVTSTGICGSDLHLYELFGPFIDEGDILGHEPMGIVEEVGADVTDLARRRPGRGAVQHLVRPLLDVRRTGCSRSARPRRCTSTAPAPRCFGYTKLYGQVAGGQAEYLRVPQAQYGPIKVPDGPPDEQFLFLSDVLPTAWQAVEYAAIPDGRDRRRARSRARSGRWRRASPATGARRVFGVDLVPERPARWPSATASRRSTSRECDDLGGALRDLHRRAGPRLGDRRRGHGGARLAGRQGRAGARRAAARRGRRAS